MLSALTQFLELGEIPARILCLSSGVFLTTNESSAALELLRRFEASGTEIFSCGTCLDYYGRKDQLQIGSVGNMADTVRAMLDFGRVLQL